MKITRQLLCFAAFGLTSAAAAANTPPEPFSTEQLSERLHVIYGGSGRGAHIGVCEGDDGLLLIDAMRAESVENLVAAIREISEKPVELVINTHAHSDHTGGNAYFSERGAIIIGHNASDFSASPAQVRTGGNFTLNYCGEQISATHLVAHTRGDLYVFFEESEALFVGDVFTNTYYATGFAKGLSSERDATELALSIATPSTRIVPGHGFIDDPTGLTRRLALTEKWFAHVGALHAAGSSVTEMMADEELIELNRQYLEHAGSRSDAAQRLERYIRRTIATEFIDSVELSSVEIESVVGRYQVDGQPDFEISNVDGEILLSQRGAFILELVPAANDRFLLRGGIDTDVTFEFDDAGKAQSLILRFGTDTVAANRRE